MNDALPIEDDLLIPAEDLSYSFTRSGGPGGQHVNTTDTKVRLRFALDACAALRPSVKDRIRARHPGLLTSDGAILVTCDTHRSRHRNIQEARDRLAEIVRACLRAPRPRRPTRPTTGSKERRLAGKKVRQGVKDGRKKVEE